MKKLPELSIFFPFWNEEKNIEKVVNLAREFAPNVAERFEIIMVDDGSSDKTLEKAKELARNKKNYIRRTNSSHVISEGNYKVVTHSPNRGYGAALKEGFQNASYKYIVFVDGDMQFDFSEVTKFVEEIKNADIVIGFRKKRRDNNLMKRLLLMNLLKIGDYILFGFSFKDIDCGFKMFRRSALDAIGPLRSEGAMVTTEILAKAIKKKLKIHQVGVEHYPRKYGSQSGANLPVVVRAIFESLILWWDIKNARF